MAATTASERDREAVEEAADLERLRPDLERLQGHRQAAVHSDAEDKDVRPHARRSQGVVAGQAVATVEAAQELRSQPRGKAPPVGRGSLEDPEKETLLKKLKKAKGCPPPKAMNEADKKQRSKLLISLQNKQIHFQEKDGVKRIKLAAKGEQPKKAEPKRVAVNSIDSMEMKLQILDEMENREGV
eukprot:CAMPEP_0170496990 /NCGR_PEP_ID=MMETSP0208-20121228/23368_1 /TAXON_ID=197538 /ORGANISM="Strombidium inclinatum, Strain S3" /LENGTH=184 /DNA_ID=CAMNT_0010773667 /DNA_START=4904 /DNA_END=5460 /DNA_ORIENTATION=-